MYVFPPNTVEPPVNAPGNTFVYVFTTTTTLVDGVRLSLIVGVRLSLIVGVEDTLNVGVDDKLNVGVTDWLIVGVDDTLASNTLNTNSPTFTSPDTPPPNTTKRYTLIDVGVSTLTVCVNTDQSLNVASSNNDQFTPSVEPNNATCVGAVPLSMPTMLYWDTTLFVGNVNCTHSPLNELVPPPGSDAVVASEPVYVPAGDEYRAADDGA